ncbi:MAG: hypothetical protein AAB587_02750 [Patescibacteria group bacterium]
MSIGVFLNQIGAAVLDPLIFLLFAVATIVFAWGMVKFIVGAGDEKTRKEGKDAILWGVVGMFIMMGVYGIIRVVLNTFSVPSNLYF